MDQNKHQIITIAKEDPSSLDACQLMDELSDTLANITGDSGRNSFDPTDVRDSRAMFVIARNQMGEAVGCGAFRAINQNIAEIKRMYAKYKAGGIGTKILSYLEMQARELGYSIIWLETRIINEQAVKFYEKMGYEQILNYGKYIDNPKAVCFEKYL